MLALLTGSEAFLGRGMAPPSRQARSAKPAMAMDGAAAGSIVQQLELLKTELQIAETKAQLEALQPQIATSAAAEAPTSLAAIVDSAAAAAGESAASAVTEVSASAVVERAVVGVQELAESASIAPPAGLVEEAGFNAWLAAGAADEAAATAVGWLKALPFLAGVPVGEASPEPAAAAAAAAMAGAIDEAKVPTDWPPAAVDTAASLNIGETLWEAPGALLSPALDSLSFHSQLSGAWLHAPLLDGLELTPLAAALQLGAIAAFGLGAAVFSADSDGTAPYQPGTNTYDPAVADKFYGKKPLIVARRLVNLGRLTSTFTAGLLWDWLVLGKLLKDEECTPLHPLLPCLLTHHRHHRPSATLHPLPFACRFPARRLPPPLRRHGAQGRGAASRQGGAGAVRAARPDVHQARPGALHPHRPHPRRLRPRAPPAPGDDAPHITPVHPSPPTAQPRSFLLLVLLPILLLLFILILASPPPPSPRRTPPARNPGPPTPAPLTPCR